MLDYNVVMIEMENKLVMLDYIVEMLGKVMMHNQID
jgi:hypothetical protein